ncbi:hypothetical protein XFF6166_140003 [Xanthomonas citri pv. fuscans]|nr:hypothetical protein XFF6166_140003 [Xanthomonas citri pv. fuscans]SOO01048.1 hypothetical protein XFF6960_410003 [Xanthomonas citri pv. fuscans]SOO06590.1 hypothetical protein XFF7767_790002 [Xanthomonas citri pv. fuscans]SOO12354.1 hypothetical protein XFF7766_1080003 [Xanthomonas citri pv. fuscans]SOO45277.1 hypothetical protein XFF1815_730003 [Xanthomonas citri pv. fuscans]
MLPLRAFHILLTAAPTKFARETWAYALQNLLAVNTAEIQDHPHLPRMLRLLPLINQQLQMQEHSMV